MVLSLPWIALLGAFFYIAASESGWLEGLSRRSRNRAWKQPTRGEEDPGVHRPGRADPSPNERLRVFEEFLRHLPRDESDDPPGQDRHPTA
jgi:hypothetical protein